MSGTPVTPETAREAIGHHRGQFTAREIAEQMWADEHGVHAACTWQVRGGAIVHAGTDGRAATFKTCDG